MASTDATRPFLTKNKLTFLLLILANILAVLIKILVSRQGHTFDFDSYLIVSDLVLEERNVYTETARYNYAPIWFLILGALRWVWYTPQNFHLALVGFLALSDFFLSLFFYRKVSSMAGIIFALNPISAIVTGYYNQFDTLAILIGLLAIQGTDQYSEKTATQHPLISGAFLGLSLCVKHLLIFLPFCLLLRSLWRKSLAGPALLQAFVAYSIFLSSFLPFLNEDNSTLILNNVFLYQSVHNVGLIRGLIENFFGHSFNSAYLFALFLLLGSSVFARATYKTNIITFTAIHMAAVFCLLPGMAPQYLVFILPLFLINWRNLYFCFAVFVATILLIAISPGLQITWLDHRFFRLAMVQLLVAAGILSLFIPTRNSNKTGEKL